MDSRTRIAILLVAVILGVNVTLSTRSQQKRAAAARAIADSVAAVMPARVDPPPSPPEVAAPWRSSAPALESSPSGQSFIRATEPTADLVIETPLQRIRISPVGAIVREITLLRYKVADSDSLVNLVRSEAVAEESRCLGLRLQASSGHAIDLSGTLFEVTGSHSSIRLETGAGPYSVELRAAAGNGGAIIKRFTVDPDRYDFQVDLALERGAGIPEIGSYALEWTAGLPVTEASSSDDVQSFRVSALGDQGIERKRPDNFKKEESVRLAGTIQWTCMQSKYFMVALIPVDTKNGTAELLGRASDHWMGMRFMQPTPWRSPVDRYRVYAGPITLDRVRDLGVGLEANVELGWRWIRPLSNLLLISMKGLRSFISNYGIIIIILSALTKLVFWPLTEKSFASMRQLQEVQPMMEELRRRYKDDPQELNRQMMTLYKSRKINPLGGCLPIAIQSPMFFALYSVLRSHIELRNAPFVGWINNLAAPDVLFQLPATLPVIGNHISLLPLLMGGSMIWQSKLQSPSAMPASGPMAQQQLLMKWLMPIMMTFIFYKMPSGLVIYWIVNTLMSIVQQAQINRKFGPTKVLATAGAAATSGSGNVATGGNHGSKRRGSATDRPGRIGSESR